MPVILFLLALANPLLGPSAHAATEAMSCYETAKSKSLLSDQESVRLCRDAYSRGPAECYEKASDIALVARDEAVRLCRCANSSEPADCFIRSKSTAPSLTDFERVDLCRRNELECLNAPYD